MELRTSQKPCPLGHYCVSGLKRACPAGRYGGATMLQTGDCSGPCSETRYGATAGATSDQCDGPCAPGHWCGAGSTSDKAQKCPGECIKCPLSSKRTLMAFHGWVLLSGGSWGNGTNCEGICQVCCRWKREVSQHRRRAVPVLYLVNIQSRRPCCYPQAGYYCPPASTSATAWECGGAGFWCGEGSAEAQQCQPGYFTVGASPTTRHAQTVCPPGYFCTGDGVVRFKRLP